MTRKLAIVTAIAAMAIPVAVPAQAICPALSFGSDGEAVRRVQQILYDSYANFPQPTGYFGSLTEAGVKQWQKEKGIVSSGSPATTGWGAVGPRTARAMGLCGESQAVVAISTPASSSQTLAIPRTLSRGMRGDDVSALQRFLIAQGHLAAGNDTGFFGTLTEAAVQRFQRIAGVVTSGDPTTTGFGIVGSRTRAAILAVSPPRVTSQASPSGPAVPQTPSPQSSGGSPGSAQTPNVQGSGEGGSNPAPLPNATAPTVSSTTPPSVTVPSVLACTLGTDKKSYAPRESIVFSWTSTKAVSARFVPQPSNGIPLPSETLSASGNKSVLAHIETPGYPNFETVGKRTVELQVKAENGATATCATRVYIGGTEDNLAFNTSYLHWQTTAPLGNRFKTNGDDILPNMSEYYPAGWNGGMGPNTTAWMSIGDVPAGLGIPGTRYLRQEWTYPPTHGSVTEQTATCGGMVSCRNTYLEHNVGVEAPIGTKYTFSFWAKADKGTIDVVPILYFGNGIRGYLNGQWYAKGEYVAVLGTWVYQQTGAEQCLAPDGSNDPPYLHWPTHSSGTVTAAPNTSYPSINGLGVQCKWTWIGPMKGVAYDLFESGPRATSGDVYAVIGVPHSGAGCTIGTSWTRCEKVIALPSLPYTNTTDYTNTQFPARTMLPLVDISTYGNAAGYYGGQPYIGISMGFDMIGKLLPNNAIQWAGVTVRPYRSGDKNYQSPAYAPSTATLHDQQRKSDIAILTHALLAYHKKHGEFPPAPGWTCIGKRSSDPCWGGEYKGSDSLNAVLLGTGVVYSIPTDPRGGNRPGDSYAYGGGGPSATLHWYYEDESVSSTDACAPGSFGGKNEAGSFCFYQIPAP